MYKYKDHNYSLEEVQDAADKEKLSIDEYIKEFNIQKTDPDPDEEGKETPSQETMDATVEVSDTASNLENKIVPQQPSTDSASETISLDSAELTDTESLSDFIENKSQITDEGVGQLRQRNRVLENEAASEVLNSQKTAYDPIELEEVIITGDASKTKPRTKKNQGEFRSITQFEESQRRSKFDIQRQQKAEEKRKNIAEGKETLPAVDNALNIIKNSLRKILATDDQAKHLYHFVGTLGYDLNANLLGKEAADKIYKENLNELGKINAKINAIESEFLPEQSFSNITKPIDFFSAVLSGGAGFVTSAAQTGFGVAPVGLGIVIADDMIKTWNDKGAEAAGLGLEEYLNQGRGEILQPLILAGGVYAIEKAQLKGIGNFIKNKFNSSQLKGFTNLLLNGGENFIQETTQFGLEELNNNLAQGMNTEKAMQEAVASMLSKEGGIEQGLKGFFGATSLGVGGKLYNKASYALRGEADNSAIAQAVQEINILNQSKYRQGITREEIANINAAIEEIKNNTKQIFDKNDRLLAVMSDEDLADIDMLFNSVEQINKKIITTSSSTALTSQEKKIINQANKELLGAINQKIFDIRSIAERTASAVNKAESTVKLIQGTTFKTFANAEEINKFLEKENIKNVPKQSLNEVAFVYQDGNEQITIINREQAAKGKRVGDAFHEAGHNFFYATFKNNPQAAINLATALKAELDLLSKYKKDIKNEEYLKRIDQYQKDFDKQIEKIEAKPLTDKFKQEDKNAAILAKKAEMAEETLTLFIEGIKNKTISYKDNVATKLADFARRSAQNFGVNIKFDTGQDVYNALKDLNASLEKGTLTFAQIKTAKEGATGKLISEKEQAVNQAETVIKESKAESIKQTLDKIDQINLDTKDNENKFKSKEEFRNSPQFGEVLQEMLAEDGLFDGLIIDKSGIDFTARNPQETTDFIENVKGDLIKRFSGKNNLGNFDPTKNSLFGYFTGNNGLIANAIKNVKKDFVERDIKTSSLDVEAGETGSIREIGAEEEVDMDAFMAQTDAINESNITNLKLIKEEIKTSDGKKITKLKENIEREVREKGPKLTEKELTYKTSPDYGTPTILKAINDSFQNSTEFKKLYDAKSKQLDREIADGKTNREGQKISKANELQKFKTGYILRPEDFAGSGNLSQKKFPIVKDFIDQNIKLIIENLPKAAVTRKDPVSKKIENTSTGVPSNFLNNPNLYTKTEERIGNNGIFVYKKRKGITSKDIFEMLEGKPLVKGKFGLPMQNAKQFINNLGQFATNQELRLQDFITPQQSADLEGGKDSRILFSKKDKNKFDEIFKDAPEEVQKYGMLLNVKPTNKAINSVLAKIEEELPIDVYDEYFEKYFKPFIEFRKFAQKQAWPWAEEKVKNTLITLSKNNPNLKLKNIKLNKDSQKVDIQFEQDGKLVLVEVKKNYEARISQIYLYEEADGKISTNNTAEKIYEDIITEADKTRNVLIDRIYRDYEKYVIKTTDTNGRVQYIVPKFAIGAARESLKKDKIAYETTIKMPIGLAVSLYNRKANKTKNVESLLISFGDLGTFYIGENKMQFPVPSFEQEGMELTVRIMDRYNPRTDPVIFDGKPFAVVSLSRIAVNTLTPKSVEILENTPSLSLQNESQARAIFKFSLSKSKAAIKNNSELPKSQRLPKGSTNEQVLAKMRGLDNQATKARLGNGEIQIFHGGSIKSVEGIKGFAYFSENKNQAKKYGEDNNGKVQSFIIKENDIFSEEVIYNEIKKLKLKPKVAGWKVSELNVYELIDPRFETSLSEKDLNKLAQALANKNIKAVRFLDMNLDSLKNDIYNIVVIDKKIIKKGDEATIKFSKSQDLNEDFNNIIEAKTGIATYKRFSPAKAQVRGASKGKFNFFIPPSAEDFTGLLYKTLAKGKVGDTQMQWYKDNLLDPYARAMNDISAARVAMFEDYKALKNDLEIIPKDLKKKSVDEYTREQAVRVYIWNDQGNNVPGLFKTDQKDLVDYVNKDSELKLFAEQLIAIQKNDEYSAPKEGWLAGNITTDLLESVNSIKRKKYLEQWQTNVDLIFSEENMNKLEAAFGRPYVKALENILQRMKTGRNKPFRTDTLAGRVTDWLNNSVGAIMFFNTRSAVLQTISSINFVNWSDNNIYQAGKAFANQPQYWKDFKFLFNSDFLMERRGGSRFNVAESDIADAAKKGGARGVISKILQAGFLPTQMADSFAIASGGATFYRNRVNSLIKKEYNNRVNEYLKQGIPAKEIKKKVDSELNEIEKLTKEKAFLDFREIAEESQQSSRPDRISAQQAGALGRVVLAFANTPAQYARLTKKAASDLINRRGDAKTNFSKLLYYGFVQNLIFNMLQKATFLLAFGDEDEDEKKKEKAYLSTINGMADGLLRGMGIQGAAISTIKNVLIKISEEAADPVSDVLDFSPPISSKYGKLQRAYRIYKWNKEEIKEKGFSLDNPAYEAAANVISASVNVPLDRVVKKVNNVVDATQENITPLERAMLAAGWSEWELGIQKPKKKKKKKTRSSGRGTGRSNNRSSNRR